MWQTGRRLVAHRTWENAAIGHAEITEVSKGARPIIALCDMRSLLGNLFNNDPVASSPRQDVVMLAVIAVISSAILTSCLSDAVLDHLAGGWVRIDPIDCAVVSGNQTPSHHH
jgi:hypothetical protein